MNVGLRSLRRLAGKLMFRTLGRRLAGQTANWMMPLVRVDRRIKYPCYKSMDDFIDIERLKSLDASILDGVARYRRERDAEVFYAGPFLHDRSSASMTGVRNIFLAQSKRAFNYFDLDKPELWGPTPEADLFPDLMEFCRSLPFEATSRIILIFDDSGTAVSAHRDHFLTDVCQDFIWMRTNLTKPFFMLNATTREKKYVSSYSAWFDTCNQYHGVDAMKSMSLSIRVDGIFSRELRRQIPVPARNPASTPALWACVPSGSEVESHRPRAAGSA